MFPVPAQALDHCGSASGCAKQCLNRSSRGSMAKKGDSAWMLATLAHAGLARVQAARDRTSRLTVRSALEEALGSIFEGKRR